MAKLSLKLVVDKVQNRVVFVESDKDFVDILFSFLTLPMGTIVRLLDKNSGVGCMDKLYESIENLDVKYLQTEACKTMLLQPRSASEKKCENLAINVNDLKPRSLYRCPSWACFTKTHCCFSRIPDTKCPCGQAMDKIFYWLKKEDKDAFVKGGTASFMISDHLRVTPISIEATLSLLKRLGIKNAKALEERTADVSKDKILSLLKISLLSKTPLTDFFLRRSDTIIYLDGEEEKFDVIRAKRVKQENESAKRSETKRVRLLENKATHSVIYAEAGVEFTDNLFSFLTFPLGTIVKLLNKNSSLGCINQLYQSVEALCLGDADYIKSEECKDMLLSPVLNSHYTCSNQVLNIEATLPMGCRLSACKICFGEDKLEFSHGLKKVSLKKINPKLRDPGTEHGGGFAKESMKFMMTNEMSVSPVSSSIVINTVKELNVPLTNLIEREINWEQREVLNLLKACLHSRTALDVAFSRKK